LSGISGEVTRLLPDWQNGDRTALDRLTPVVYAELRRLARSYMRQERPDHTLQPTALVHEAYLRLVDQSSPNWQNRHHFFGVAAQIMRQVLVDQARHRRAAKRDAGCRVTMSETLAISGNRNVDMLDLDHALDELGKVDPRKTRIVELRFFGGLTVEETALALDISAPTVRREMRMAETWLYQRIKTQQA
jgi:RNA polymerase sigma factor (TIGR02999 family)